jgi:hypothetical protein
MSDSADEGVQVQPLDEDGVGAVALGTVAWTIALVVLFLLRDRLTQDGAEWWIWVALTGALLGLPGLWYTTRRRAAYRKRSAS